MSRYELFDRSRIHLRSLDERGSDLSWRDCYDLKPAKNPFVHQQLANLIQRIQMARQERRAVIAMIGGHVIKLGLSRFVIDLMRRGFITHLATNGAGIIHDFELASFGGTSENVAKWIEQGQFGLWQETAKLNDAICEAAKRGEGLGESVGRALNEQAVPHAALSIAAAGWRLGVPVTCHVSIGSDIIHGMPNCNGAALGQASYTDFLIFARSVQNLEGGVFLNIGTAVTGPEVYLKALSMARNVAHQAGREIRKITTAVFDLQPLPDNFRDGPPSKQHELYYYRPWKTILVRTVADGGTSHYFQGDHTETIPTLWHQLTSLRAEEREPSTHAT